MLLLLKAHLLHHRRRGLLLLLLQLLWRRRRPLLLLLESGLGAERSSRRERGSAAKGGQRSLRRRCCLPRRGAQEARGMLPRDERWLLLDLLLLQWRWRGCRTAVGACFLVLFWAGRGFKGCEEGTRKEKEATSKRKRMGAR